MIFPLAVKIFNPIHITEFSILPLTLLCLALVGVIIRIVSRLRMLPRVPAAAEMIMDSIHEGIIITDSSGKIVGKNAAVDEFVIELTSGKHYLLYRNIRILLMEWPQWVSACLGMQAAELEIGTTKLLSKRYYQVKVYPLFGLNLKKRGTVSILYDITERKNKEAELRSCTELRKAQLNELAQELDLQKKKLESITENMSDHCWVIDKSGKYNLVNSSAKELFSPLEIKQIGDYLKSARCFDIRGNEISRESVPAARVMNGEKLENYRMILKNGTKEIHFDVNGTPVYDENGKILFGVICSHDRTELVEKENTIKSQQEQLLKAERIKNLALRRIIKKRERIEELSKLNSLKDKLLTVVSHDIRLPMSSMISLIEILEDEAGGDSDNLEIIKAVKEQINNTRKIVDNLLEWLKSQMDGFVYHPLVLDLSKLIREAVTLHSSSAEAKDINITAHIAKERYVYADKEMLELVIRNLLSNAVKFTRCGGTVAIRSRTSGNETVVAVEDTGVGMTEDKLKILFLGADAGHTVGTAGEKGAGLGLLLCKEFVSHNGGRIWVDSIPGKGSTFYFSLLSADKLHR